MSELIVVGFDAELKADEVLLDLYRKESGYRINLEDAAVVIRRSDGEILIRHAHPLVTALGARGTFWGLLIGALLLNPLAGIIVGGAVGATVGSLQHLGIEDSFIRSLGEKAAPGSSILFILEHEASPDSAYAERKKYDGQLLRTSFGFSNEQKLREALESRKHSGER